MGINDFPFRLWPRIKIVDELPLECHFDTVEEEDTKWPAASYGSMRNEDGDLMEFSLEAFGISEDELEDLPEGEDDAEEDPDEDYRGVIWMARNEIRGIPQWVYCFTHEYGHFLVDWLTMPMSEDAAKKAQLLYHRLWDILVHGEIPYETGRLMIDKCPFLPEPLKDALTDKWADLWSSLDRVICGPNDHPEDEESR